MSSKLDDRPWQPEDPRAQDLLDAARQEEVPDDLHDQLRRVLGLEDMGAGAALEPLPPYARPRRLARAGVVAGALGMAVACTFLVLFFSRDEAGPPLTVRPTEEGELAPAPQEKAATGAAVSCPDRVRADGSEPLIDDFEDRNGRLSLVEGRFGVWELYTADPSKDKVLRPARASDGHALHVALPALKGWGAVVVAILGPPCYDASRYAGIAFRARGTGTLRLAIQQYDVVPKHDGGGCENDCYDTHGTLMRVTKGQTDYEVRWEQLEQRRGHAPLDPSALRAVTFEFGPADTPADLWIDDLRFLPRAP
jgi:hypothetical protein